MHIYLYTSNWQVINSQRKQKLACDASKVTEGPKKIKKITEANKRMFDKWRKNILLPIPKN